MVHRLHIFPPPCADEAAAIESAIATLLGQREAQARAAALHIAYRDLLRGELAIASTWKDVARRESLDAQAHAGR